MTNMIGRLPGYPGKVWYNPDGIANILSLADMEKYFFIKYNSDTEKVFIMEKPNGMEKCFVKNDTGLYNLAITADPITSDQGITLMTTVADKQSNYTVRAY